MLVSMGRRKKRRSVRRPHWRERRPPKVFQCPVCGAVSIVVKIEEDGGRTALISCSNPKCRMRSRIENVPRLFTPVDVYSMFMDMYVEGKAKIWFEEAEEAGESEVEGEGRGVSEEEEE